MDENIVPGASSVVAQNIAQDVDARLTAMFVKPEAVIGIQSTYTQQVEPIRAPNDTDQDFLFEMPNTGTAYMDLKNIELYIKGRLKKRDGTALAKDEEVVVTNNFLHSLFESITLYVGTNQQEIYIPQHPYKAYLKQLKRHTANHEPDCRAQGFNLDLYEELDPNEYTSSIRRKHFTSESKQVEFMGPTLIDFFSTRGYLLPATPLRLKYRKNRDAFYVMTPKTGVNVEYNFCIEKIVLHVPCVNIAPDLTQLLEMQTEEEPACYEYQALDMKQFAVPQGTIIQRFNRVFQGKIPNKIAIAFFKQSSFSGKRDEAPFFTSSMDLTQLTLYVNGVAIREISNNFKANLYLDSYRKFVDWLGYNEQEFLLSYSMFKEGYSFFCVDLLENCHKDNLCSDDILTQGTLDISIQLGTASDKHCVMAVFAEVPETVEISKERAARHVKSID